MTLKKYPDIERLGHEDNKKQSSLIEDKCLKCGKLIIHFRSKKRKYCSHSCHMSVRNKINNPAKNYHWKSNPSIYKKMKRILTENREKRVLPEGKNHYLWRGNKAAYISKHSWIRRKLGVPKVCKCCKTKINLNWANKNHKYKRNISDWISLCVKCHWKYDKINNNRIKK